MKNIIAVSDLQMQAAKILSDVNASSEPIIITQSGRPAAVLMSVERYEQIEKNLEEFDDLELRHLIALGEKALANGDCISHKEVKRRLNFPG